jgi:ornithine carbamoyltransferase
MKVESDLKVGRADAARAAMAQQAKRLSFSRKSPARTLLAPEDLAPTLLQDLVRDGLSIKSGVLDVSRALAGRRVALLFQKTSTRTRCSFEVGIWDMGGNASVIDWNTSNFVLSDLEDEVRVIARYYDAVVARVRNHSDLLTMRDATNVPLINGLSDLHHPCQALSDYMTMAEVFGDLRGLKVAYIGDGNNVCASLLAAAPAYGVQITVASPPGYEPAAAAMAKAGKFAKLSTSPVLAVSDADVIYTDTWVSIGMEAEREARLHAFSSYRVNRQLVARAPSHALIMHCLPAHPGEEISSDVLRGPRSIVLDQAENRKYMQMALLRLLLATPAE